jgi:hypothetical protein
MWSDLIDWADCHLVNPEFQMANPEDIRIPTCVDSADEAIAILTKLHASWSKENGSPST